MFNELHKQTFRCALFIITALLLSGCAGLVKKAEPDYKVDLTDMGFVFVKGGTFEMGSTERPNEQPVHSVTVDDLFVGMYEVTFDQYKPYCDSTSRCEMPPDNQWGKSDRPVIYVSWHDANAYATWLSEQTGLEFRLPTEAEWEYFARAGTTTPYWTGMTLPKKAANCKDCGSKWAGKMTAPVGSFRPNPWNIYDTIGNVNEWVSSDYTDSYSETADKSATTHRRGDRKVQRGGAWNYSARDSRSAARDYRREHTRTDDAGFRLVLVPSEAIQIPPSK